MSAYLILRFEITDPEQYAEYRSKAGAMLIAAGAQVHVASDDPQVLEGDPPGMTVVLGFASDREAIAFYNSPDYASLKALRLSATRNASCILAPGFTMPTS